MLIFVWTGKQRKKNPAEAGFIAHGSLRNGFDFATHVRIAEPSCAYVSEAVKRWMRVQASSRSASEVA